ncbi:MAG: class I SAM-dependent methyltransferase [Christensenella sp.]|uniref:tRNA (adenine(22)-N(1))-methyltransferase n=1 Tax=Christensenella sp. TaxID=1935934 RepID=UPI002B20CA9C|nr:class I SAM-dependent methyltransferase [Christensenella sp.]MEA5003696.1 class I SAM-dependent methyltransferase [Christensenella sp.]
MEDKLSRRMRAIVDKIDHVHIAADIGCDHGLVGEALIKETRADKIIAGDISEKSLQKTIDLACGNCWKDRLDARNGNGLSVLVKGEADVIILAGMGGFLVRSILENDLEIAHSAKKIICMPHGNEYELRVFLYENNFLIADEELVQEENHYYQLMEVVSGEDDMPNQLELFFGRRLLEKRQPPLKQYLMSRKKKLEYVIEHAKQGRNTEEYRKKMSELHEQITEVLRCL